MQAITQPITAAALDLTLAFLAPLFLHTAEGNPEAARLAAAETLQGYAARNEQELRLAAQVIAFSLRALDALARAADPDLDVKAVLRLNTSATSLNRAAMRCQKELDKLRAQSLPQEQACTAEPSEHPALAPAAPCVEPLSPAIPEVTASSAPASPRLSRQQRRRAERLAKRELRRHPDLTRQIEHTLLNLRERAAAL